ncbi:hypothetical protein BD779DRAFT_1574500 [Infundibulicybe gibba]|nr:hypothetical protein BD779DRAFT_1574500 [Infundibulicybe gibba]
MLPMPNPTPSQYHQTADNQCVFASYSSYLSPKINRFPQYHRITGGMTGPWVGLNISEARYAMVSIPHGPCFPPHYPVARPPHLCSPPHVSL